MERTQTPRRQPRPAATGRPESRKRKRPVDFGPERSNAASSHGLVGRRLAPQIDTAFSGVEIDVAKLVRGEVQVG